MVAHARTVPFEGHPPPERKKQEVYNYEHIKTFPFVARLRENGSAPRSSWNVGTGAVCPVSSEGPPAWHRTRCQETETLSIHNSERF